MAYPSEAGQTKAPSPSNSTLQSLGSLSAPPVNKERRPMVKTVREIGGGWRGRSLQTVHATPHHTTTHASTLFVTELQKDGECPKGRQCMRAPFHRKPQNICEVHPRQGFWVRFPRVHGTGEGWVHVLCPPLNSVRRNSTLAEFYHASEQNRTTILA